MMLIDDEGDGWCDDDVAVVVLIVIRGS